MTLLASGISGIDYIAAFDKLYEKRFAELDVSCVLTYLIDQVPAAALPYLGDQFDVMGYKGWDFTTSEQDKRDLIKRAIELHRYKGTPWAIKAALKVIGFWDAVIIEKEAVKHNGTIRRRDGSFVRGAADWTHFRVELDLGNYRGLSDSQTALMTLLINEYKPVRSLLIGTTFKATLSDQAPEAVEEASITLAMPDLSDTFGRGIKHNGVALRNRVHKRNNGFERLTMDVELSGVNDTIPSGAESVSIQVLNLRGEEIDNITF